MFYCEKCRIKKDWPSSFMRSSGRCEVCGEPEMCHDRPSKSLPRPAISSLPPSPPGQPRQIPDSECVQAKCACVTTGCWGECNLKRWPVLYANSGAMIPAPPEQLRPISTSTAAEGQWMGDPVPPGQPSTLAQQVAKAKAEMASWSPEVRSSVRLEGGDQVSGQPEWCELQQEFSADIFGAIARGWCAPINAVKVIDVDLAIAIAREVDAALAARQAPDGGRGAADAARWQFMMRVVDDDEGPEALAINALGNAQMETDQPESEQMNELADQAIALVAQEKAK